jgi:hypothetical protein
MPEHRPSIEAIVADLDATERGFVLGWLLSGSPQPTESLAAVLAPPTGERCARAAVAIAALAHPDRVWLTTRLARDALAPIPAGIENVHADTLREALRAEATETIQLMATDAPPVVRAACADALEGRPGTPPSPRHASVVAPEVVADLQRAVLASIVAVPAQPLADQRSSRWAYRLARLAPTEILTEVMRAGADLLGTSLQGADDATLRRAAAHLPPPWSERIIDRARERGTTDKDADTTVPTRSEARALVAATPPAHDPLRTLARLGARALGDRLNREDPTLAVAVAQRLSAELSRELLLAAKY